LGHATKTGGVNRLSQYPEFRGKLRKGSVGEVNFSQIPCSPIDTTYYVDQFPCENPKYWFYKLKQLDLGTLNKSTAIPGFNRGDAYSQTIQLPPLPEQKRIADKLDTVLARVDACRERLNRVPLILKRFRQSVLVAATSGQLTADWRDARIANSNSSPVTIRTAKDELDEYLESRRGLEKKEPPQPDLTYWTLSVPTSWIICSVNQFAECLDRLRVPIKRENRSSANGHFPYYGANGEVSRIDEFIFDDELVLVTEDETFYGREKPIAYRSSGKCWVNNHAHVLKPKTKIAADYLCYALMYYDVIPWLSGTTGRAKLTQAALNALPIAMPPAFEMAEIVRRVETLFAFADRLEARLATACTVTDRLTPALLAKAFRGELVPQDPNDEPAAELLKRLAATRTATSVKPRRGRVVALKER
jgi:type I restriction enzyme, S subunit